MSTPTNVRTEGRSLRITQEPAEAAADVLPCPGTDLEGLVSIEDGLVPTEDKDGFPLD